MHNKNRCLLCQSSRKSGCRLFRFPPRGSPMWHRWLEACGLKESGVDSDTMPRLCQLHFQPKDFLTRQLTRMAVPSLFPLTVITEADSGGGSAREVEASRDDEYQRQGVADATAEEVLEVEEVESFQEEENLDSLIEYEETPDERLLDFDLQEPLIVEEDYLEFESVEPAVSETIEEPSVSSCTIAEHDRLLEELEKERARVEFLEKELVERGKIITRQYKLLSELGVQVITFTDQ